MPSKTAKTSNLDPAIAKRLTTADVIVRGTMFVGATDDAHVGSIRVDAVLKGAIASDVSFISAPYDVGDGPAIYFLQRDGDRYRVIDGGGPLGIEVAQEAAIAGAVGDASRVDWSVVTAELAVFRKAAGAEWRPEQQPAVDAARKIFATVPMVGLATSELRQVLGAPDEVMPDGRWRYVRHNGEAGAMYALRISGDHVRVIEIHRTQ